MPHNHAFRVHNLHHYNEAYSQPVQMDATRQGGGTEQVISEGSQPVGGGTQSRRGGGRKRPRGKASVQDDLDAFDLGL